MTTRLGNVLYWLGVIVAVLVINGAFIWNVAVFTQWSQANAEQNAIIAKHAKHQGEIRLHLAPDWNYPSIDGARRAGFTMDKEIADYLVKIWNYEDISGARKAGMSDAEIIEYLILPNRWQEESSARYRGMIFSRYLGGVLVLVGLIAFGVGWAARCVSRRRS